MAFRALASDFSPFVHHPSFLLKSDRTPSPPSHIRRDFGSPSAQNSIWTAWKELTTQLLYTLAQFKLNSMLFGQISNYLGQQ